MTRQPSDLARASKRREERPMASKTFTHTVRKSYPDGGVSLLPVRVQMGAFVYAAGSDLRGPLCDRVVRGQIRVAEAQGATVEVVEGTEEYDARLGDLLPAYAAILEAGQ